MSPPAHRTSEQRGPNRAIANDVAISPCGGAKPRMEAFSNVLGPMDPDVVGQVSVCAHHPCLEAPASRVVEMHDLSKAVHTGISPPCAGGSNRLAGNFTERCLKRLLHRGNTQMRLSLPAVIVPSVVFNPRRNAATRSKG